MPSESDFENRKGLHSQLLAGSPLMLERCWRSVDSLDEDVGLHKRLPVAGTAVNRLLAAVARDVSDKPGFIRELALELGDRVQLAPIVVHRRQVDPLTRELHVMAVGVDLHGQDVEELEAESIFRHLDLRQIAGLDLFRRAPVEEGAREEEFDVRLAHIVHLIPLLGLGMLLF